MIRIEVTVVHRQENLYQLKRKEMIKVNREAYRHRRGYQCGKPIGSPHQRHRGQDHRNMEKIHTTKTLGDDIKNQRLKTTGEMTKRDHRITLIDMINTRIENKVLVLGMTTITVMNIRAMMVGGKRKAILPGGGGHMYREVGIGAMDLGTANTAMAAVPHKTMTETLPMRTLETK